MSESEPKSWSLKRRLAVRLTILAVIAILAPLAFTLIFSTTYVETVILSPLMSLAHAQRTAAERHQRDSPAAPFA